MGNEGSQPCDTKKLANDMVVTWKKLRECPYQPREGQSCVVVGETLYIFGGVICTVVEGDTGQKTVSNQETNQLLRFHVGSNSWEEVAASGTIPEPRSGSMLAAVAGKIFMFGGLSENHGWSDDFYVFNIETSEWSKIDDFAGETPSPRDKLSSTVIGNTVYVFGGFGPDPQPEEDLDVIPEDDGDEEYEDVEIQELAQEQMAAKFTWFADLYKYDAVSHAWSCINAGGGNSSPSARAAHSMCSINGSIVVFGGRDSMGRTNDAWSFSPETNQWVALRPTGVAPEARSFHASVGIGDRMVVLGGRSITNQHFRDFHVLDLKSNQWLQPTVKGDVIPPSTGMHSLAIVGKHLVLTFGASEMDPVTNSCTKYHHDTFAVAIEDVLAGGAVIAKSEPTKKETENSNGTKEALSGVLNLRQTTTNVNGK